MRWCCLLLLFLAAIPAHAQDKPTVLLMDESVSTVSGARERLGFERLPIGEEDPSWHGGPGKTGKTMLGTAGAVAFGGLGAAIGVGVMDGLAQERRNETIQALRTAVEQDKRLYGVFLAAVNKEASRRGMQINDTFLSQRTEVGVVAKFGKAGGAALSLAGDDVPMVTLSWDDRFPLMALDVRRFRMSRTGTGLLPREEAARIVRYVGHPAPAKDDAVAFWAADGAKGFLAEIDAGLAALLPVALSDDLDVPSVKRKGAGAPDDRRPATGVPGSLVEAGGRLGLSVQQR